MAKIEILDTPPGAAPLEIRKLWVGLFLTLAEDVTENGLQIGVDGSKPQNVGGYRIDKDEAMTVLAGKDASAAQWWLERLPETTLCLVFSKEVCRVVEEE